jgi:hypothetical protein
VHRPPAFGSRAPWRFGLAALLALLALPAAAKEVVRTENGTTVDLSGFYKVQLSGFFLHPDAVETLRAQARLVERAQDSAPPGVELPALAVPPSAGGLQSHVVRVAARFHFLERFDFEAAWQVGFFGASDAAWGTAAASASETRRLVPIGGELVSSPTFRIAHELDRFALKIALPFGDLTLGRQVLSWGTGRFWNPTDVLSPFSPSAVDREVRRGFDAARLAIALGDVTQLDVIYLPRVVPAEMGGVLRLQTNLLGWDGSVSVGKYLRDLVFGADLAGDLGPLGVHAEGAYTLELAGLGGSEVGVGDHFFRGVIGVDWRPLEKLVLMAEYHFNGYGSANPARYAQLQRSERVGRGEIFGVGKHQAALAVSVPADDVFSAQLAVLANLADPSFLLVPSFEWSLEQTVLLRGGAYLPIGRTPDAAVFDALGASDVFGQSEAFTAAVNSRGLRSEYGASPFGVFLQLGLHLP